MPEITPERLKAFIDDLAMLSAKHGLTVAAAMDGNPSVAECLPHWRGYHVRLDGGRLLHLIGFDVDEQWPTAAEHVSSINPFIATAHQRIALTRSLARVEG